MQGEHRGTGAVLAEGLRVDVEDAGRAGRETGRRLARGLAVLSSNDVLAQLDQVQAAGVGLQLCEHRPVHHQHAPVRQQDDGRRRHHALVHAERQVGGRRRLQVAMATAAATAEGAAARRPPTTVGHDEAQHSHHHQQRRQPLALLGVHGAGRAATAAARRLHHLAVLVGLPQRLHTVPGRLRQQGGG